MLLPPNSVGECIMFSGCPIVPFVHVFIRSDIVTTVSYECLEQFW